MINYTEEELDYFFSNEYKKEKVKTLLNAYKNISVGDYDKFQDGAFEEIKHEAFISLRTEILERLLLLIKKSGII